MTGKGFVMATGICLGLGIAAPSFGATHHTASKPAARTSAPAETVDPAAVKALRDMSAFLQTLPAFELTSETSLDLVQNNSQKIQMDRVAHYTVRKPNAFVVNVESDAWNRRYIYDGHQFTLYAPKLDYYATWPAPATIQATISEIESRFGVSIPLDDLFRWSSAEGARADSLTGAFLVGTATLDGVKTNQYAFREGQIDWQIWIQQGDKPLPLKLVIVDRRDTANPAYTARLSWTLNPTLTDQDFAFRPDQDAKRIRITLQQ